ncbi:MAG: hypothetical protein ABID71_04815 [Chloroflexota bacterium]
MIKRILLLAVLLVLALSVPVAAADPGGIIEGQLINGTANSTSPTGLAVTLSVFFNDVETESTVTTADADDRFVFTGLDTGPEYRYEAATRYQGVEYRSEPVTFENGDPSGAADIIVYDTTASDEAILVMMSHMILSSQPDSLLVREYYLFVNYSDRTYLGPGGDAARGTLRFSLPPGAVNLRLTMGLLDGDILLNEDGFMDTRPLPPGSHELAFSYVVGRDSGRYTLNQPIYYPTNRFDLLIQSEDIQVSSAQLAQDEPMDIGGQTYGHLSGQGLAAGNTLAINVSGESGTGGPGLYWLVPLVIVVAAAVFIPLYLVRKRRLRPVPAGGAADRQLLLLNEIAELDESFEAGQINEEDYHARRDAMKAELRALMQSKEE